MRDSECNSAEAQQAHLHCWLSKQLGYPSVRIRIEQCDQSSSGVIGRRLLTAETAEVNAAGAHDASVDPGDLSMAIDPTVARLLRRAQMDPSDLLLASYQGRHLLESVPLSNDSMVIAQGGNPLEVKFSVLPANSTSFSRQEGQVVTNDVLAKLTSVMRRNVTIVHESYRLAVLDVQDGSKPSGTAASAAPSGGTTASPPPPPTSSSSSSVGIIVAVAASSVVVIGLVATAVIVKRSRSQRERESRLNLNEERAKQNAKQNLGQC